MRKLNFKSSLSPIGIDIGSAQIKIIQLQQKAGNLSLLSHAVIPTPTGAVFEGQISNPQKFSVKLKQLKKKLKLKGNLVNLCLGPEAHYLRLIVLPPLSKRDLQKTLPWEIEKHFPLKTKNAVYDCCPLSESKGSGNGSQKYILAAAEVETAVNLTRAAEKAGFKLLSLEVSPLSLLRVEALSPNGNPGGNGSSGKALLDIGYRSSTLLLTGEGTLRYSRHLRIGVLDFLKEVADAKGISLTEAQRSIFGQGTLAAVSAMKSAELLAEQITGSIGYHLDRSGTGSIEPNLLVISGGGASIPGLIVFLQNKLSIKVEPQLLPGFSGGRPDSRAAVPPINSTIYATAFGLALRGWIR